MKIDIDKLADAYMEKYVKPAHDDGEIPEWTNAIMDELEHLFDLESKLSTVLKERHNFEYRY